MADRIEKRFEEAKAVYAEAGVDAERALAALADYPISMHCWQGDDVTGFDHDGPLTGGIQATGNYPGKARTPDELMADIDEALSMVPGTHRLNLHANYAIFGAGGRADRDRIEPGHFAAWVDFAKARGLGLDFNGTYFSHPKADGATLATLTNPDPAVRDFWVDHTKACIRIAQHFADALGTHSLFDVWIPDGLKDVPADRTGPRARYADSMDRALAEPHDKGRVFVAIESKVFGIGVESYTAGSGEFALGYAASRGITPLFDNGHYHPTENVADKIPSVLLFFDRVALHVTRSVRWDSDHVIRLNDEVRDIAGEIVRAGPGRVLIGTDFFDASINRVAAWVMGMRNLQKALLEALLTPHEKFAALQDEGRFTELFAAQEALKTMPAGDVWDAACARAGVPLERDWYRELARYEKEVLSRRA
ncbi:MAG: L-rhamnose isomerase [Clostridiales Family XIII bacterium]|jgi:L-rhamnose isomerase|nr:L-rhamnose isomerase [Clostridiales Family XIII bacterium]